MTRHGALYLHDNVEAGYIDNVRGELDAGADIEVPDPHNGKTPLMTSAFHGRSECMSLLIERGADIHAIHVNGGSLLHHVCEGAFLNSVFGDGRESNYAECADILIKLGADVTVENNSGQTYADLLKKNEFREGSALYDGYHAALAERSKKSLLDSLDKEFIPCEQAQEPTQQRRRAM